MAIMTAKAPGKLRTLRGNPAFIAAVALMFIIIVPGLVASLVMDKDAVRIMAGTPNSLPSSEHLLGTQSEGRDVLSLLLVGTPSTLMIGLIGGCVGVIIGVTLGLISGFVGGRTDTIIRTVVDVGLTIPSLAILILIAASFRGMTLSLMGLVVAITAWMHSARTIRSQVLSLRERNFVLMARLSGAKDRHLIFQEIMPNLIPYIASSFVDAVSTAILASIGLEVLGLGPQKAQTLGNTIYFAIFYSAMWRGLWWWWLPPIIILIGIFVALFLLSISLDEFANPRLNRAS